LSDSTLPDLPPFFSGAAAKITLRLAPSNFALISNVCCTEGFAPADVVGLDDATCLASFWLFFKSLFVVADKFAKELAFPDCRFPPRLFNRSDNFFDNCFWRFLSFEPRASK